MTADIEQVTRVQGLDHKIVELEREVATLPKHIARIEKALESHMRRLDGDRAALLANQKDRKRLEDDIKVHELKISKLKDQTLQAKTNEQYRAFQSEIDFAAREIRKCEDRILEQMGLSEPLEANVKKAEAALREEQKHVEAEKERARERTATDQQQLDALRANRKAAVAEMLPQLYATYVRLMKKRKGLAVAAEVMEGRCSACQMALRPQFFQDVRRGDEMMFCESCGCILYYNPPVSFEQDLAAQQR